MSISIEDIKNKKHKYVINLKFNYSDESLESTEANPLYLDGVKRDELRKEKYILKYNEFNHGLVDYLKMDFEELINIRI